MPEPILAPIETDPDEIAAIGYESLEASIPGWDRSRADIMTKIVLSLARMVAEARDTAADVPLAILRYIGEWVAQLPPVDASLASTTATVVMADAAGYTLASGTRFEVKASGDESHVFVVRDEVTVLPTFMSTAVGGVELVAETAGAAATGLPITSVVVPVDALAFIATVTLTATTTGGEDAETEDEYTSRLIEEFRLITGTPILPDDFAVLARRVPGVGRSLALNLYNPAAPATPTERYVSVAVVDIMGEPVSASVKTAVSVYLESLREVNFVVPVIDATYTAIAVTTALITYAGFDEATIEAAVADALRVYLSPATAARPGNNEPSVEWIDIDTIRRDELTAVVNGVTGVNYLTSLTFAASGGALGTADVALNGAAALPRSGTIVVNASNP